MNFTLLFKISEETHSIHSFVLKAVRQSVVVC